MAKVTLPTILLQWFKPITVDEALVSVVGEDALVVAEVVDAVSLVEPKLST